jgi:MFS family permease
MSEGRFAALSAPLYRRYWLGSICSVGATQFVMMGQSWLVFELSGSAADLAILGLASSLPTIILVFFGGVVADRFDRRKIMLITTPLSAALLASLAILDGTDTVAVWHVWLIAALFASVAGFDWPAWQSLFPLLIERRHMMSAVSLNAMLWQGTRMIMPGIGGFVIAAFTTAAVFAVSAVGFLAQFFVIASLKVRAVSGESVSARQALVNGLRFVADNRLFTVLIPLSYAITFFGTSYLQIMPLFVDRMESGAQSFGFLMSGSGLGAVAGTLITASLQSSPRLGRIMLAAAIGASLAQLGFCAVTQWWPTHPWTFPLALASIVVTAALTSVFLISSMSVLQLAVPEALRGRVMSMHGITFSMIAMGALFSGSLAEFIGAPIAVAVGAVVVVGVTMWVWWTQPVVRDIRGD